MQIYTTHANKDEFLTNLHKNHIKIQNHHTLRTVQIKKNHRSGLGFKYTLFSRVSETVIFWQHLVNGTRNLQFWIYNNISFSFVYEPKSV